MIGLRGGQTFIERANQVTASKTEKKHRIWLTIFRKGSFSKHIGSRLPECVNTGIDIFEARGPGTAVSTISPSPFQNPSQVRLKNSWKFDLSSRSFDDQWSRSSCMSLYVRWQDKRIETIRVTVSLFVLELFSITY